MNCRYRLLAIAACGFLATGCSFLSTVVKEQYELAAATDMACNEVDDTFVEPPTVDELKAQLVGRLRLQLTGVICSQDCTSDNEHFKRTRFDEVLSGVGSRVVAVRKDQEWRVDRIRGEIANIRAALALIKKAIGTVEKELETLKIGDCSMRSACANRLLVAAGNMASMLNPDAYKRDGAPAPHVAIERSLAKIDVEVRTIVVAIKADYPDVADQLDLAVLEAREVLRRAKQAIRLFVARDVTRLTEEFFVTNLRFEVADRVLGWFSSGLQSVDRIIDKADDRLFLFPTLILNAGGSGIQSAFDGFYEKVLARDLQRLDIELAFAKAACNRLTDESRQSSQLMPFVHRMFATGFFRHVKDPEASVADDDAEIKSGAVAAYVRTEGRRLNVAGMLSGTQATVASLVQVDPTDGKVDRKTYQQAVNRVPPLTELGEYEYCYASRVAVAMELRRANGGLAGPPESAVRSLGARVCGRAIAGLRARDPLSLDEFAAVIRSAPGSSTAVPDVPAAKTAEDVTDLRSTMQFYARQLQ